MFVFVVVVVLVVALVCSRNKHTLIKQTISSKSNVCLYIFKLA